jgi:small subunit ribosomal protein S9
MTTTKLNPKTPAKSTTAHKPKDSKYFEGVGRRKTAIARVRISSGKGSVVVNGKTLEKYFVLAKEREAAVAPLAKLKLDNQFDVNAKVSGGGIMAQSEALRHGLARAIVLFDEEFKKRLRVLGFLTRDSRMVERKKYGMKKARRAPQWKKR